MKSDKKCSKFSWCRSGGRIHGSLPMGSKHSVEEKFEIVMEALT